MSENALEPGVLFVGNIPYSMENEALGRLFEEIGGVERAVVVRDERDRSRGFGFVCFQSPELASAALAKFNGQIVESRPIRIKEARQDSHYLELIKS